MADQVDVQRIDEVALDALEDVDVDDVPRRLVHQQAFALQRRLQFAIERLGGHALLFARFDERQRLLGAPAVEVHERARGAFEQVVGVRAGKRLAAVGHRPVRQQVQFGRREEFGIAGQQDAQQRRSRTRRREHEHGALVLRRAVVGQVAHREPAAEGGELPGGDALLLRHRIHALRIGRGRAGRRRGHAVVEPFGDELGDLPHGHVVDVLPALHQQVLEAELGLELAFDGDRHLDEIDRREADVPDHGRAGVHAAFELDVPILGEVGDHADDPLLHRFDRVHVCCSPKIRPEPLSFR